MSLRLRRLADRWLLPLALFAALAALLLAVNWPWPRYFSTAFIRHWDPPFHAWKLTFAARAILAGHVLPPGGNSNCFFPSSLTFYYEALHWPQSAFAAGTLLFTDNPVFVYHMTLLVFWAFSGVCFYWLLRELRCGRPTAILGAAIFCVLPYRRFYFCEFNMQLCAGLVLSILFGLRFFTRRGFWSGVALGLAFWFQAASELYQALIFTMLAPFLFASFLGERDLWRDRRFWGGVAGLAITVPLTLYFVHGYAVLHDVEGMARDLNEIMRHVLEPFSYIVPPGCRGFLNRRIRTDETSFNPTLPVLALSFVYAWTKRWRSGSAASGMGGAFPVLRRLRLVAAVATVVVVATIELVRGALGSATEAAFNISVLSLLATTLTLQQIAPHRSTARKLISGLGSAACIAFLLSLGPEIGIRSTGLHIENWLFVWTYRTVPLLNGMRVVSRFGFMVDVFMLVTAMVAWNSMCHRWRPLAVAGPLLLFGVILSYPHGLGSFDPCDWAPKSAVVAAARADGSPVLFVPFGSRDHDSLSMLAIGRHDLPLLYGWGGFYPWYQTQLLDASHRGDDDRLASLLGEVWPDARVLVDKRLVAAIAAKRPATPSIRALTQRSTVLAEDDDYALLALPPTTNAVVHRARQTRRDYLDANPYLRLTARGAQAGQRICLLVNGAWAAEISLAATSLTYVFEVPPALRLTVHPTEVEARSIDGAAWHADRMAFSDCPPLGDDVAVQAHSQPPNPWPAALAEGPDLPVDATPADIRFAGGLRLRAVAAPPAPVRAGGNATLRFYWTCDPAARISAALLFFVHAKAGDTTAFQRDDGLLADTPSGHFRCQPYRKVFTQDVRLEVPPHTAPGDYALEAGLYTPNGPRVRGRSELPEHRRSFRLPVVVRVAE